MGCAVGLDEETALVGEEEVGRVVLTVGAGTGCFVGVFFLIVGRAVGFALGDVVGTLLGDTVGTSEGDAVGTSLGEAVGNREGCLVGNVGFVVGLVLSVGLAVVGTPLGAALGYCDGVVEGLLVLTGLGVGLPLAVG